MLHSTLSLFAVIITLASSNRLLLQQFVPIPSQPVATAQPVTDPPVQGPPAGVSTGPPVAVPNPNPPAATTGAPVSVPPATTAAQAPPVVTYYDPNRYNNQYNVPGSPQGPGYGYYQPKLECKLPGNPMNPQSCAAKTMAFSNVNENFEVSCAAFEACTGAQMTFTWDQYAPQQMEMFKKLSFGSEFAAAGAVFTFSSLGPQITIDEIKCAKNGACQDAQFIIGDGIVLEHGDFFCEMNSCHGCVVRQGGPLAAAEPCWSYVDII